MKYRLVIVSLFMLTTLASQAQSGVLEEYFFESGKIKVVIAVALTIGVGIFAYLFRLDKKISDLEQKNK